MPDKQEMEEQLNDFLDKDINWAHLDSEDLQEVFMMFNEEQEKLLKKMASNKLGDEVGGKVTEFTEEQIEDWEPGDIAMQLLMKVNK